MSVNYHVFSSIHASLLLGNPPIWSCAEYQFLLLASLVRVFVALIVKLNCHLVSVLTVIVTTMMVQSAQYVDVTNLKD